MTNPTVTNRDWACLSHGHEIHRRTMPFRDRACRKAQYETTVTRAAFSRHGTVGTVPAARASLNHHPRAGANQ